MRVREGQVIGYVGATGLATGPHLDYRIQRGGKFVDPLKLTAIPGPPLPAQYLSRFQAQKRAYLNLMGALAYKNGSSNNQSDNSP
jgi:murein DD-endopeptidase MepM/ murein hydrolase activator NlpD